MMHLYALAAYAAHLLRRTLPTGAPTLLLVLLLPWAARAQAPPVTVTPAGPLTLCAGTTQTLTATGGTLPGFNAAGSGFNGSVFAVAVQPDGKVLVGGAFTSYNGNAAAPDRVLRLNADGTLDPGFNPGGAGANYDVYELAVQPDGKVLVGGDFTAYNGNAAPDELLRLNADGSLDTGFNPGGAGASSSVYAVAVQPDGKVLVGGAFTSYNGNAAAPDRVLRLNADGTLDPGFNPGGTGASSYSFSYVNAVAVQPDGKVLVGGAFTSYNGNAAAPDNLLRLNADGSLDTGFNPGGAGANGEVRALAVQPDGKVLVGGYFTSYNGNAAPERVLRLNADGSLDTGFNPGGAGASSYVYALAVQPDGKVLVGGYFTSYNGNAAPERVLRLNADGSLDTGFNPGGAGASSYVYALAVQPDGKVLVGGYLTSYNGNAAAPDNLLRLYANGTLDDGTQPGLIPYVWSNGAIGASISVSGPGDYQATATGAGYSNVVRVNAAPPVSVQLTPVGPLALPAGGSATLTATATLAAFNAAGSGFNGTVSAVLVQADGRVLVGGTFTSYNGNAAAPDNLLRLNADGSLDTGFNPGGAGANGEVRALAMQPAGKVLVGGDFTAYNGSATAPDRVLRLNADGTLDPGFNAGGAGSNGAVLALAVQANGSVTIAGAFNAYNGNAAAPDGVLRLSANGLFDGSFNSGGSGFDAYALTPGFPLLFDIRVQADGKVLVAGDFTAYNGSAAAPDGVLRLNADGTLDTTFNPGGSGLGTGRGASLAVQADGKVLVGGTFISYNGSAAAPDNLVRLNANGSLDASFNPGGSGTSGPVGGAVGRLVLLANGQVLVAGAFAAYNGANVPGFLRLNANGLLDATFNPGGSGFVNAVNALAEQLNGQVLVGGAFVSYNGNAAAPDGLLRLNANGSLNDAATPLAGATFAFNPGNTTGATRAVSTAGTYTATATDPATGCPFASNAVVVTGGTLATAAGQAAAVVQLYPNPARGAVATLTGTTPGTAVKVYDVLGRAVLTATADATGTAALKLPAGLPVGVYLVRAADKALRLTVE